VPQAEPSVAAAAGAAASSSPTQLSYVFASPQYQAIVTGAINAALTAASSTVTGAVASSSASNLGLSDQLAATQTALAAQGLPTSSIDSSLDGPVDMLNTALAVLDDYQVIASIKSMGTNLSPACFAGIALGIAAVLATWLAMAFAYRHFVAQARRGLYPFPRHLGGVKNAVNYIGVQVSQA
jgi:hypothetical protein